MRARRVLLAGIALFFGILAVAGLLWAQYDLPAESRGRTVAESRSAQGGTVMAVASPGAVPVGAVFNITFTLSGNSQPAGAFQFDLAYDPAVIAFRHTESGPYLGTTGRQVVCPPAAVAAGSVRLACASTGRSDGPSGDGTLAVLVFEGLADGVSDLTLSGVQLVSSARPPAVIPAGTQNSQVTVGVPPPPENEIFLPLVLRGEGA